MNLDVKCPKCGNIMKFQIYERFISFGWFCEKCPNNIFWQNEIIFKMSAKHGHKTDTEEDFDPLQSHMMVKS